ncbi:MAG TPA: hypothetical protein VFD23_02020, partial [Clostridia bacterium]|nr:hypothetical protein [Clostridia bacterium]
LDRTIYEPGSLLAVDEAVGYCEESINQAYKKPLQSWVDGLTGMLENALSNLVYKPADYSQVEHNWLSKPDDILTSYTQESVDALYNYYNNEIIKTLLADDQATVDGYAATLITLINALVLKDADYTAVDNALRAIPDNDGNNINVNYTYLNSIYTINSVTNLYNVVNEVNRNKKINEQAVVNGYAANIILMTSALDPKVADYQYLGMALNRSTPFPESYYTDVTYASYRDAMNAGSLLYNNQNLDVLDQPIINDATALINSTFEALVLKDVTYTVRYETVGGSPLATDVVKNATAGDTVTEVAMAITGYTPVQTSQQIELTGTNAENVIIFIYEPGAYAIAFDANGGEGGRGPTSMASGAVLTAPAVTKEGYVLAGWLPELPTTVPRADTTYVAQWVQTVVNVTKTESGMVVNIQGWTASSRYQIWSYQQITSDSLFGDDTNVQANQWILAMHYALGSAGDLQGDGSINFLVPNFRSPTENYLMAVRVADADNNFVQEIRDAYTPENVSEVVITKILVDGAVTTGYELREIMGGAKTRIKVIGNNVSGMAYTAKQLAGPTEVELVISNVNEFLWDISDLDPGIYTIEITATNGNTAATQTITFELFSLSTEIDYGTIDEMTLTQDLETGIMTVNPIFANGTFSYRVREPGRAPLHRSVEYYNAEQIAPYSLTKPGLYHVNGYVTRAGFIGTEKGGFDDGIIRTLLVPRTGPGSGPITMTFTGNQALSDVSKGTPLVFTADATGLPEAVQYSFWRYDATGYVLVKDWSSDNTFSWTPARIGEYSLEARAKGAGAGSYEVSRSLTVNITDSVEEKADITGITLNIDDLTAAQAKQPIMLKANATSLNGEDLLYKFYVYDNDMRNTQLKGYSVDQQCVWIPRKAGMTYTISVLVKNQASFGKYDAIESFEVTVD